MRMIWSTVPIFAMSCDNLRIRLSANPIVRCEQIFACPASPDTTKVILITSAASQEGKTSTAINLATTLLTEDKKVLLIDANFRRPTSLRTIPKQHRCGKSGFKQSTYRPMFYSDAIRPQLFLILILSIAVPCRRILPNF